MCSKYWHGFQILVVMIYQQVQCWCSSIMHGCWSDVSLRYNMIVFFKVLSLCDSVSDEPRIYCSLKSVDKPAAFCFVVVFSKGKNTPDWNSRKYVCPHPGQQERMQRLWWLPVMAGSLPEQITRLLGVLWKRCFQSSWNYVNAKTVSQIRSIQSVRLWDSP